MKKKAVHIHFVCKGNIFRSRLAEAYLGSKRIPNILVSSSGTEASVQHKGPITWYAQRLLFRHGLIPYMSNEWKETSLKQISKADIIIFIGKDNYQYCRKRFSIPKKYKIWDLPDFDDTHLNGKPLDIKKEMEYLELSEKIFRQIKRKVDKLIAKINTNGFIDKLKR